MAWLVALCVFIVLIVIFTCFIRYLRHDQTLSVKSLFWIYFRTFALIGLLILIIGGLTPVVQAVFSLIFGPEFSYSSHEEYYSGARRIVVDGSPSASLVTGITLSIVGLLIWSGHLFGARKLATIAPEVTEHFVGVFSLLGLLVFSLVALSSLTATIPSVVQFMVQESDTTIIEIDTPKEPPPEHANQNTDTAKLERPMDGWITDRSSGPGNSLALFLTSCPIWIFTIRQTFKTLR
ncbi:hypothetical protein M1N17_01455 [Dehalococcoidia bacterium]|nr:hypothetical protein [Dehalococcoidia bacterium]